MRPTLLPMLLALYACRSAPAPAPAPLSPPTTHTPDAAVAVDATPPSPAPSAEADVRTVLDRWLQAQNANDMNAYSALFAERFEGVRRSGPRTRRFNHAAWLVDRQRMFQSRQEVQLRDLVVEVTGATAVARFTQEYRAGDYHDVGPKQVVLVRGADGWRIAREEMLASTLSGGSDDPVAPGEMMPIVSTNDGAWAVIDSTPDDVDGIGDPTLVDRAEVMAAYKPVDLTRMPEAVRALDGATVSLYDDAGGHCTATLRGVGLLSRVDVHFGTEQRWRGEDGEAPSPEREIAATVWEQGSVLLVARLTPAEGRCGATTWARRQNLPAPRVFAGRDATAAQRTVALAAFRALPAWRTLQQAYRDERHTPATVRWDEHDRTRPEVRMWSGGANARRFVTVTAAVFTGGCAEFSGQLAAVFEADAQGRLTLRSDGESPEFFVPTAAVDLDGDGVPEWTTEGGVVALRDGHAGTLLSTRHRDLDCGC